MNRFSTDGGGRMTGRIREEALQPMQTQRRNTLSRVHDITLKDDFHNDSTTANGGDFGMDDFGDGGKGVQGESMADFGLTDHDMMIARRDAEASHSMISDRLREQAPEGRQTLGEALYGDDDDGEAGAEDHHHHLQPQDNKDQRSIIDAPDSSFALEPLEAIAAEKATRQRRRCRLIIDDQKNISGEEMKNNMADYRDTLQPLDLAPPTRRLMRLKESENVEKLFHLPGSSFVKNKNLIRQYQSKLTFTCRQSFATGPSGNMLDESIEDIRRDLEYDDNIEDTDDRSTIFGGGAIDDFDDGNFKDIGTPMSIGGGSPIHGMNFDDQPSVDSGGAAAEDKSPPSKKYRLENAVHGDDDRAERGGEGPEQGDGGLEQGDGGLEQGDGGLEQGDGGLEQGDGGLEQGDGGLEQGDGGLEPQNMLNIIASKIRSSEDGEIMFSDLLTKGSTRKTAAQKFNNLLVLTKWQAVDVAQAEPYGEIRIRPGPQMDETAGS